MPEGGREIGRPEAEELLTKFERVAVLRGKGAGRGNAFDIRQQQTSAASGKMPSTSRARSAGARGMAGRRNFTRDRYSECRKTQKCRRDDGQCDNGERDGPSGQPTLAEQKQKDSNAPDSEDKVVALSDLRRQLHDPIEKVVSAASNSQQIWYLAHGDRSARTDLESDENAVAHQLDEDAES